MHWRLIHNYLSGKCTTAERQQVEQWLAENDRNQSAMREIRSIWQVEPSDETSVDAKQAWQEFRKKHICVKPEARPGAARINPHKKNRQVVASSLKWYQKTPVYVAAAIIILAATVLFVARTPFGVLQTDPFHRVATKSGEKITLKLKDGTRVHLNSESVLKIPSDYGKTTRRIYLRGEAFFKVKHNAAKPFEVVAGNTVMRDVGTQFNVRSFPGDTLTEVVVAKGRVALHKVKDERQSPALLRSGQRAVIRTGQDPQVRPVQNLSFYTGWVDGLLVFNRTPFNDVLQQLERRYSVNCSVADPQLLDQKFTATFENESLANVLKLISKSMNVDVQLTNRHVVFRTR